VRTPVDRERALRGIIYANGHLEVSNMAEKRVFGSVHFERHGIHLGGAAPPVELLPGEQIVRSAQAKMIQGEGGTLILTNMRIMFEPANRDAKSLRMHRMVLPLAEVTVLGVKKPLIAGDPLLLVGKKWHEIELWIQEAGQWVQDIEGVRSGHGPMAPPPAPFAPPEAPMDMESAPTATSIPCAICGTMTVRQPDGSLTCPHCSPGN